MKTTIRMFYKNLPIPNLLHNLMIYITAMKMIYITTAKTEKITMSKKMLALTETDLQIKKLLKVLA